jgi:glutaredoxin
MNRLGRWRFSFSLLGLWALALALAASPPGRADASESATAPDLVVYVRSGCPHCEHAKDFLRTLATEQPQLRIELRAVDERANYAEELMAHSQAAGVWPPGAPAFLIGNELLVGFDERGQRASELRARVLPAPGGAAHPPVQPPSPLPGWLDASRLSLPMFTLAMGLLDGFNPCAMWVLLFLLSLLLRLGDRLRMAMIAGTFVLVSGAVYYAFLAAWLNLFLIVGFGTAVRVTLAAIALLFALLNLKDGLVGRHGPSLSIPDSAKPGIYARVRALLTSQGIGASLLGVTVLAVMVNTVELLCTAGLPALHTAVLTQQVDSAGLRYAYLALYILGYMADDGLMVALTVTALGSRKLSEGAGRGLKLLSGAVMLALALVLLLKPEWLLCSRAMRRPPHSDIRRSRGVFTASRAWPRSTRKTRDAAARASLGVRGKAWCLNSMKSREAVNAESVQRAATVGERRWRAAAAARSAQAVCVQNAQASIAGTH